MSDIENFSSLFAGNENRFLTFTKVGEPDEDGKRKPDYRTVKREPSSQTWAQHISGDTSLGLSPLRDGKCKWAAIDVDLYPCLETEDEVTNLLRAWSEPVLIARSKSGGVHIIAFSQDWVDADTFRDYMVAKRNLTLAPQTAKHAQEVFPKQSDGDGSQMNLPSFGDQRQVIAWSRPGVSAYVTEDNPVDWADVHARCHVTEADMLRTILAAKTPKKKERSAAPKRERKSGGGFKRPTSGKPMEGRNTFLYHCGASARGRGADNDQIEEIIRAVNEEFATGEAEFDTPLDERELVKVIQQVKKLPQQEPRDLAYDVVERMNEKWAMVMVDGRVEFLERATSVVYPLRDFSLRTKPMVVSVNGKPRQMSELWIADPDRLEFDGIVIEPPDYDGKGLNVFDGWAVVPKPGDAGMWVDYVERLLCGGDKDLAHWVMSWIADAVQRPWSLHPGTALALRGRQGGGKSFLGKMLQRIMKPSQIVEIADSERIFERFNRKMFGATFVLAEESIFAGARKQANTMKAFITSHTWTYEQKFLASFDGKNVHRLIATTNEAQAVHIDDDDRRWTVIEVEPMFEDMTTQDARDAWQPYYDLDPGVILGYLMQYEVDRDLIARPFITEAKREDKMASDPVLELFHDIAMTGIIPDDVLADGCIAAGVLLREAKARGAGPYTRSITLTKHAKKMLGYGEAVRNAKHIVNLHRTVDSGGVPMVTPEFEQAGRARGLDLGTLEQFRARVAKITDQDYPDTGSWEAYRVPQPGDNGHGPTEHDYEDWKAAHDRMAQKVDVPF